MDTWGDRRSVQEEGTETSVQPTVPNKLKRTAAKLDFLVSIEKNESQLDSTAY